MQARATSYASLTIAALVALLASLAPTAPAFAAVTFVKAAPVPGSTVGPATQTVTVVFSDLVVAPRSSLQVWAPNGTRVDQGSARIDPSGRALVVSLQPPLAPGEYTVRWTAIAAADGQPTSGLFYFTVAPIVRTVPTPNQQVKWALPGSTVSVGFNTPLKPQGSRIVVTGPSGVREDQGNSHLDASGLTLSVSLDPNAPHGDYEAIWTAVTASDGATYTGAFRFTLLQDQRPGLPTAAPPAPAATPSEPAPASSLPRSGGLPLALPLAAGLATVAAGLLARRVGLGRETGETP